jgi:cytochrome c oxidase cbb3-type subunit 1
VAANAVGVWLATLLLWPDLNDLTAPLTYGRWVPLHLDWQLYGWCALPLVGVLFRFYFDDSVATRRAGRLGLWVWTLALAYAGVTWLAGGASGKLFLNFAGSARVVWSIALLVLWGLIAWRGRKDGRVRPGLLLVLLAVPLVLYWAAGPGVYPAVNPDSGGATGTSLLGSTLALVAVFGALPHLLRLEKIRLEKLFWPAFAVSAAFYAGMRHTHASHHELGQVVGLGLLLTWIPLVVGYARSWSWAGDSRRWLAAAFGWWLVLVITGFLTFLPGFSERLKFTNALVAHSHLAMAGLVTCLHGALLLNLSGSWRPAAWSFRAWQAGCAVHCAALLWLGWQEGADLTILYGRGGVADWCYGLRLAAGLVMFAASINWLWAAWKNDQE